tara:strand:- start:524 stop:1735 length:1212 start_codon:yes stop_codon:yes gene_type:complete
MGSVARVIKKTTKAVTKPLSKAFKGIAKGIKKVGKATMRGIAKVNRKLGPLGSIALAVAMPYALGGLSTMTTAAMNSTNTFLQAIGNVGNAIRTGYQAFNAGVSKTFSSITNSIKQGFSKFAPKTEGNIFSRISKGAKNLFQSAKNVSKKYSPIKGKQGTVTVSDSLDQVYTLTSDEAAKQLAAGSLDVADISKQTLGSNKWFVQGSNASDKIVTDTINEAYKSTLDTYGPGAKRYFNDLKAKAIDMKTYVNDSDIGSLVESKSFNAEIYDSLDPAVINRLDVNLATNKDYTALNEEGTEFLFNGNDTFGTGEKATGFTTKAKSAGKSAVSSLLKKKEKPVDITKVDFSFGSGSNTMTDITGTYGGTDISGSAGGNLLQGVYSDADRMKIMNYYKNMNLIGSS